MINVSELDENRTCPPVFFKFCVIQERYQKLKMKRVVDFFHTKISFLKKKFTHQHRS